MKIKKKNWGGGSWSWGWGKVGGSSFWENSQKFLFFGGEGRGGRGWVGGGEVGGGQGRCNKEVKFL